MKAALVETREIEFKEYRVKLLCTIAEQMEASTRHEILEEAIIVGRQLDDDDGRARALAAVASGLRGARRDEILREALAAARMSVTKEMTFWGYLDRKDVHLLRDALFRQLDQRPVALTDVVEVLNPEDEGLLQEAYAIAGLIGNGKKRADLLVCLAERYGSHDRGPIVYRALEAGGAIQDEEVRAKISTAIATRLGTRARSEVLYSTLKTIRLIGSEWKRRIALFDMTDILTFGDQDLVKHVLTETYHFKDEQQKSRALVPAVTKLQTDDPAFVDALAVARDMQNRFEKARALSALAVAKKTDKDLILEALTNVKGLEDIADLVAIQIF